MCAALAPQIIESQLFGHVRGAFTGAVADHKGVFRAADRGTLFLDEVGELPVDLQPKLLRVLQDGQVVPLGGMTPTQVDVRVVAATNRDLAAAIEAGGFRRDLYARLALWEIAVPPLRERRVDILAWLARLHRIWIDQRAGAQAALLELAPDAIEAIVLHPWPDNLRGLDRLIHQLAGGPQRGTIARADLPPALRGAAAPVATAPVAAVPPRERREAPTREELERVYRELGGSVRALAKHYGRDRKQIYRWLATHGLRASSDE
jgi:transcriptional regulator with PAS, ATPase and Fis domain